MSPPHRGRLKVFLGYAAGVGKTYKMLEDAQELRAAGVDVAIGWFEAHGRKDTIARTEGLETLPRRKVSYRGAVFEEMDPDAILKRRPAVCLVDELAHTNVPGSEREKRWEDVVALLDAGLDVHTTVNIQHLESLNDEVRGFTGVQVRETVPDWVVDEADEVVFVDLTTRALRNRLERGVVYGTEKAQRAMQSFFNERNLNYLRELALRHAAHDVEGRRAALRARSGGRILICLTANPSSAYLIRRGKRVADYLRADCLAIHVRAPFTSARAAAGRRRDVERNLDFARDLHIEVHVVESERIAAAIAEFAAAHQVTQIFMGRSGRAPFWRCFGETVVQQVARLARDRQVTIVAHRRAP